MRPVMLALSLFALFVSACGSAEDPVASFDLSLAEERLELSRGENASVGVTVNRTGGFDGAVTVALAGPPSGVSADPLTIDAGSQGGSFRLHASQDAGIGDHTLTVRGEGGGLASEATLMLVVTANPPEIVSFEATPEVIAAGETSLLSWEVRDAETLRLEPGGVDVGGLTSYGVSPESTTVYTLHADNAAGSDAATVTVTVEEAEPFSLLVFTKTNDFRHGAIPVAVEAITRLGQENDFEVVHTENAGEFTDENLARHAAVMFLLTSDDESTPEDVLDDAQKAAFERYIAGGGGFVGVHSASDTGYGWPWYEALVGAYFADHPMGALQFQEAAIIVEDPDHPSTAHLPDLWLRTDEWYNFRTNPRDRGVNVLLRLDTESYQGSTMGEDHPIAWSHENLGGRAWYTAGGHTEESYGEEFFLQHLLGGILYAAGR